MNDNTFPWWQKYYWQRRIIRFFKCHFLDKHCWCKTSPLPYEDEKACLYCNKLQEQG